MTDKFIARKFKFLRDTTNFYNSIGEELMNNGLTLVVLAVLAGSGPKLAVAQEAKATATTQELEQIIIARSVRDSVIAPTEFCTKVNSGVNQASSESQFSFRAVLTRALDGRVVDAESTTIGSIHTCIGSTTNPENSEFYGEGTIDGVTFKGFGDCINTKVNFPEKGLFGVRCYLILRDLPDQYVGGQLTTNTMTSQNKVGPETDPSGYRQMSIATVRLWKKRGGL